MCYGVLQCVAVCCSVLKCVAVCYRVLQLATVVVVCCSVLPCALAAACVNRYVLSRRACQMQGALASGAVFLCCSALQCAALCCSVLQFCIGKRYIGTYSLNEPVICKANWYWA